MPSSLFGAAPTSPTTISSVPVQQPQINQISNDPVAEVEKAIQQSGGDPQAAFYALARQKGKDPDQVLRQINSMGNMQEMAKNVLFSNPRLRRLMSLFSMTH